MAEAPRLQQRMEEPGSLAALGFLEGASLTKSWSFRSCLLFSLILSTHLLVIVFNHQWSFFFLTKPSPPWPWDFKQLFFFCDLNSASNVKSWLCPFLHILKCPVFRKTFLYPPSLKRTFFCPAHLLYYFTLFISLIEWLRIFPHLTYYFITHQLEVVGPNGKLPDLVFFTACLLVVSVIAVPGAQ